MSPFYANYGFNLKASWEARDIKYLIKAATVKADKLKDLHQKLSRDIKWINQRITLYANKSRLERPYLQKSVIVLAEPRAVRDGGLRPIRDRDGTPRTHVTAGESYVLAFKDLGASRCGRILWLL
jgi:hypothetical protein